MSGLKDFKLDDSTIGYLVQMITQMDLTKPKRVQIIEWRERRSLSQNALVHKWFGELSEYLIAKGREFATPEWCKEAMKHSFLGYEKRPIMDVKTGQSQEVLTLRHTSKLDTGQMTYFMDEMFAWCQGIGCNLTIPNDSEYAKIKQAENG